MCRMAPDRALFRTPLSNAARAAARWPHPPNTPSSASRCMATASAGSGMPNPKSASSDSSTMRRSSRADWLCGCQGAQGCGGEGGRGRRGCRGQRGGVGCVSSMGDGIDLWRQCWGAAAVQSAQALTHLRHAAAQPTAACIPPHPHQITLCCTTVQYMLCFKSHDLGQGPAAAPAGTRAASSPPAPAGAAPTR